MEPVPGAKGRPGAGGRRPPRRQVYGRPHPAPGINQASLWLPWVARPKRVSKAHKVGGTTEYPGSSGLQASWSKLPPHPQLRGSRTWGGWGCPGLPPGTRGPWLHSPPGAILTVPQSRFQRANQGPPESASRELSRSPSLGNVITLWHVPHIPCGDQGLTLREATIWPRNAQPREWQGQALTQAGLRSPSHLATAPHVAPHVASHVGPACPAQVSLQEDPARVEGVKQDQARELVPFVLSGGQEASLRLSHAQQGEQRL